MTEERQTAVPDKWVPGYPTNHIRTSLNAKEFHPSEAFAINIIRQIPRAYMEEMAEHVSNELKKEQFSGHSMGVVWESMRKLLNGEPVHGRYLMGVALYITSTLMDVGATCGKLAAALPKHRAQQEEDITYVEEDEDEVEAEVDQDSTT